jgi:hypothetical protein
MKEELLGLSINDPLAPVDESKAKAFFAKYGSMQTIEEKLALPNFVSCVRHVWRDHELTKEEVVALKEIVTVLQKTHGQVLQNFLN